MYVCMYVYIYIYIYIYMLPYIVVRHAASRYAIFIFRNA